MVEGLGRGALQHFDGFWGSRIVVKVWFSFALLGFFGFWAYLNVQPMPSTFYRQPEGCIEGGLFCLGPKPTTANPET